MHQCVLVLHGEARVLKWRRTYDTLPPGRLLWIPKAKLR